MTGLLEIYILCAVFPSLKTWLVVTLVLSFGYAIATKGWEK